MLLQLDQYIDFHVVFITISLMIFLNYAIQQEEHILLKKK